MIITLSLNQFSSKDIDNCKFSKNNVLIIGKRETGKTSIIYDILYHNRKKWKNHLLFIFNPLEPLSKEYHSTLCENDKFKSPVITFNEFSLDILETISKVNKPKIIIYDNCFYESLSKYASTMFPLFDNPNTINLISMAYATKMEPRLRTRLDYVFSLRENCISNRKRLYELYFGMCPSFDVFNEILNQTTIDYECLILNNMTKSSDLKDHIYWYHVEKKQFIDTNLNKNPNKKKFKPFRLPYIIKGYKQCLFYLQKLNVPVDLHYFITMKFI